ncbi:hypothetical protein FQA39_LY10016 [Lamprigera yunnana]|nr:hypothetical protein FQA39_LY10016 [Lamprigera yunnana]
MDNLAAVFYGVNDLRLEQTPIPTPKDDEVLLKMEAVGICGTDLHVLNQGTIGSYIVETPLVMGHEGSATIEKIGKNVKHLKLGDRVAIEPLVGCRRCNYCRSGRYNLCPKVERVSSGRLVRHYVHDSDTCFKLPEHVTLEEGALLEPLSVSVHACKRGAISFGDNVLVLGAGPIGLLALQVAKAFGASKVVITDIVQWKLDVAKSLGADYAVLGKVDDSEDDIVKKIVDVLGTNPTKSIDCVGIERTTRVAIKATISGGMVVLVGVGDDEIKIPSTDMLLREIDIRGVMGYANDYPTSIELVASGKVNVKSLITHHFKIEDIHKAFHVAKNGEGNPIKILIHVNPEWNY